MLTVVAVSSGRRIEGGKRARGALYGPCGRDSTCSPNGRLNICKSKINAAMATKKMQLHNLTYRCRSASLAPSAGSYNPPSTGTGIAPGAILSKVTGLTICFTDTLRISSVDKKVKSTLVT